MKNPLFKILLFISFISQAQVGINTTTPDASAMMDVVSNNAGMLIPRLTTIHRDAISLPATSLLIYNSDLNEYQYNFGTPAIPIWVSLETVSTKGQSLKYSNTDTTTNLNVTSAIQLPIFGTLQWNDNSSLYSVAGNTVTVSETGKYQIIVNVSLTATSNQRTAPYTRITVNGVEVGSFAATGYARRANGHNFSSLNLTEIVSLNAGDVVAINVQRDANLGTATMRSSGSSNFSIIKLD
jgi:hypothetical protein